MEDDRAAKAARAKALASPTLTALFIETVAHIAFIFPKLLQMLTPQCNEIFIASHGNRWQNGKRKEQTALGLGVLRRVRHRAWRAPLGVIIVLLRALRILIQERRRKQGMLGRLHSLNMLHVPPVPRNLRECTYQIKQEYIVYEVHSEGRSRR